MIPVAPEPIVYERLDLPAAQARAHESAESEELGTDAEVNFSSDESVEEWRVPVLVLFLQRAPVFEVLWVARGESADSWLSRASILVSPPGGRYEVVLPSFQPDGRFLFLLAMPMFWRQQGQHAVLLCDARTPLRAYLQLAGPHDMLGDILPLHGQGVNEVVSVFRGVQGAPTAAVDFQHPEVASTFLFQPAAWAPPAFRLAETFLSDHACRWGLDESPPTFHSDPLCYLLLGQGDEQLVFCLQPGPIAPQVAAIVHIPCSRLVLTLQRGLFADPCIHGQPVHRAVCFRDSMCLPHPPSFALFIDAREFGATLCARVFPRLLLTVGELLHAADAHVPDGEAVVVRGGTPDPGLPHAFRFVEGDTGRLTLSDVREQSPIRPPATPMDGSPTSDTETSGRYRSRSGDRAAPSTRASSSGHVCARLNDNRGVACDHMWTPGPSHLDVPPASTTPLGSRLPALPLSQPSPLLSLARFPHRAVRLSKPQYWILRLGPLLPLFLRLLAHHLWLALSVFCRHFLGLAALCLRLRHRGLALSISIGSRLSLKGAPTAPLPAHPSGLRHPNAGRLKGGVLRPCRLHPLLLPWRIICHVGSMTSRDSRCRSARLLEICWTSCAHGLMLHGNMSCLPLVAYIRRPCEV